MARFTSALIDSESPTEGSSGFNALRDSPKLPVVIRMADTGDSGLIYSSWLKAHSGQNKDQPYAILKKAHGDVVAKILENSLTVIAAQEDQTDQIFAWACGMRTKNNKLVMHYCYTKAPFRALGLARLLLNTFEYKPGEAIYCSHRSYIFNDLKKSYNLFYVPHLQDPDNVEKLESGEWSLG